MKDYFNLSLETEDIGKISSLGLAHMGDAVYELLVRSWLCESGKVTNRGLHAAAIRYVSAPAQARAAEAVIGELTDEELAVFKRGRNTKVNSVPQKADVNEYHAATGLETLFGWLFLSGDMQRANSLFCKIMEVCSNAS